MGADIVIVVNIGTPLLKKQDIQSLVGVSLQMVNILTEQNVRRLARFAKKAKTF